jgi:hypothetical protein
VVSRETGGPAPDERRAGMGPPGNIDAMSCPRDARRQAAMGGVRRCGAKC